MSALMDYLHMDGYGLYVWGAYGLAAIILLGLLFTSILGLRQKQAEAERLEASHPRRRARPAKTSSANAAPTTQA